MLQNIAEMTRLRDRMCNMLHKQQKLKGQYLSQSVAFKLVIQYNVIKSDLQ